MALTVIALCAAVALLYFAAPVIIPIVLAFFLFYALDPIVDWLQRWRVPRVIGSCAAVLALVGALGTGGIALWPQIETVVAEVPEGVQRLRATLRARARAEQNTALDRVREAAEAIDEAAVESQEAPRLPRGTMRVEVVTPWRASDWLWRGGMSAVGLLGQVMVVLFLTIFMLVEDDSFKRKLVRRMETLGSRRVTVKMLDQIASHIERFIWIQVLTSAGVGAVTSIILWWMGVEQPAVWGIFAGVMNIVPYFGPIIVTAVLGAVGFLQFGTITGGLAVAGVSLAITSIEGWLVTPHLVSRAAALNHVAVFVSIAFWSWIWGGAGLLLAVPLLMVGKTVCDHVEGLGTIGDFLGE